MLKLRSFPCRLIVLVLCVLTLAPVTAPSLVHAAAGRVHEFTVPTPSSLPQDITSGPDHNLWFTEANGNKIGRLTPQGIFTEFATPTVNSSPYGITRGPDGNLWFTESNSNQVGRITPQGVITEYA